MTEKSMTIVLVVAGAVLILIAALAVLGGSNLLQIPGTDFFAFLDRMFDFLNQQIGLAGKQTREWFCSKELQDNIEMCKLTPDMLREYCGMADKEKIGVCQTPGDEIKAFCEESWSKREQICKDQNDFNSACETVNEKGEKWGTEDLPFCK